MTGRLGVSAVVRCGGSGMPGSTLPPPTVSSRASAARRDPAIASGRPRQVSASPAGGAPLCPRATLPSRDPSATLGMTGRLGVSDVAAGQGCSTLPFYHRPCHPARARRGGIPPSPPGGSRQVSASPASGVPLCPRATLPSWDPSATLGMTGRRGVSAVVRCGGSGMPGSRPGRSPHAG